MTTGPTSDADSTVTATSPQFPWADLFDCIPPRDEPRQLIAIRVDPSVLAAFRKEARRRRVGYQTLINEVLAEHTRKDVA